MMRNWSLAVLAIVGVAGFWFTKPSGDQLDLNNCQPRGTLASISERWYGATFWTTQLGYLKDQKIADQRYAAIDDVNAKAKGLVEASRMKLQEVYKKHPELAPSAESVLADRLRERANEIESQASIDMMRSMINRRALQMSKCETYAEQKIAGR